MWAQDDMFRPLNLPEQQKKGKKARSLSLGEEGESKKGVSSLLSKASEARSQAKKLMINGPRPETQFKEAERAQIQEEELPNQILRSLQQEEERKSNHDEQMQQRVNEEAEQNPLEVPSEKEDKKTADDEGSAGIPCDLRDEEIERQDQLFDHSLND